MHARDQKELSSAMQAFLLHFCNVITPLVATRWRASANFSHWAVDAERLSRRSLAEADWAMKVNC
jgi:hypothetical protein